MDARMSEGDGRVRSIDLLRGAVMVLMVIDHVRVYSGVPAGGPEPAVFFTRWVTHFCAPVFVFLAGTSAFLYGRSHQGLPRFLATRGLWLILLELTFLRLAWTFNFDFGGYALFGVIWVLGAGMLALAALCRLPWPSIAAFGAIVVGGHNLLDSRFGQIAEGAGGDPLGWLWKILYVGFFAGPIEFAGEGSSLWVLYSLVPWVGVMALGFAFGQLFSLETSRRHRLLLQIGLAATALFVLLRACGLYGEPRSWAAASEHLPSLLAFLNTSKYPASLQFLLMTLGPAIALMPLLERARGPVARALETFGRVPLFFYLLHIPLVHLLAILVVLVRKGGVDPWLFANHPMGNPPAPELYAWSLPLLYLVGAVATLILYFACRAFADFKKRRPAGWLRYL
jgi:uncharacterized membrane protein